MRSQWKRLLWAAMLSCSCFAATLLWYQSTKTDLSRNSGDKPVAQVASVGDEVLKKTATRLLWQAVNTGDYLYNNETIRTSEHGEIRIQFENNGAYIDLEADSLVVIQEKKGEIALDLMEGSVFVNAKNEGNANATKLVLNSSGTKVDLSGATGSLSKTKNGGIDLQVLEGTATVKDKDGKSKEVGSGSAVVGSNDGLKIEVLSPALQKPVYIDPEAAQATTFKWKGFPSQFKVSLVAGPSRKDLKEVSSTANPGTAELQAKFGVGKLFWKLVAKDLKTGEVKGESTLYKTEFLARYAPTVLFPLVNADLPVERFPSNVLFKWQKGDEATRVSLEVSNDPNLKTKIITRTVDDVEEFNVQNLKEGEYYWRLGAYYPDSDRPVLGKVHKFKLTKPLARDPVRITWAIPENKLQQYFTDQPELQLNWKPENRQNEVASFKLKIVEEKGLSDEALRFQSKDTQFKAKLPKAGRYIASVEAIDKEGNSIGRSDPKTLVASALPLLSAPQIMPMEGVIKSRGDGYSDLKWQSVEGAKEYELMIENKDGKELAKKRYQNNQTSLKNLLPGEYTIKLVAIDQFGRTGQAGPARTLVVPNQSNIQAPKLKKIKVN